MRGYQAGSGLCSWPYVRTPVVFGAAVYLSPLLKNLASVRNYHVEIVGIKNNISHEAYTRLASRSLRIWRLGFCYVDRVHPEVGKTHHEGGTFIPVSKRVVSRQMHGEPSASIKHRLVTRPIANYLEGSRNRTLQCSTVYAETKILFKLTIRRKAITTSSVQGASEFHEQLYLALLAPGG